MKCIFCNTDDQVRKQPAFSKPGKWIKEGRVFTVPVCERDRDIAQQSFDTPFSDREVINLYKRTVST